MPDFLMAGEGCLNRLRSVASVLTDGDPVDCRRISLGCAAAGALTGGVDRALARRLPDGLTTWEVTIAQLLSQQNHRPACGGHGTLAAPRSGSLAHELRHQAQFQRAIIAHGAAS